MQLDDFPWPPARLKLTFVDGSTLEGNYTCLQPAYSSQNGKDIIDIDYGSSGIPVNCEDVKSYEILSD